MEYMYEELPNSSSPARRRGVFATAALLLSIPYPAGTTFEVSGFAVAW